MWPTRSFVNAAVSIAWLSALPPAVGMLALLRAVERNRERQAPAGTQGHHGRDAQ
jgi:hypothetical protein